MCEFAGVMGAMIGLATVVIIAIVAWLINYMVKFMFGRVLFRTRTELSFINCSVRNTEFIWASGPCSGDTECRGFCIRWKSVCRIFGSEWKWLVLLWIIPYDLLRSLFLILCCNVCWIYPKCL